MGKESNCLAQKYKAMGKESNFLFPSECTAILPHKSFSTWGKKSSFLHLAMQSYPFSANSSPTWGRVKLSSAKMQSYLSRQILPILCREGFFSIMQNFYKSIPTNLYHFFFFFFFSFHFIFIYLFFYFILLVFFLLFKVSFKFLFFFAKLEILPQREKIIPQHFGRIIEE